MLTLRHAWRSLWRSPGFVVISVLALGLGLGLSTTMFAVLDAVVHPYMPYRDPDTLFRVHWWYSLRGAKVTGGDLYRAVRDETHSFESVIAVGGARLSLETENDSRDVFAARVPPAYWPVTGVRPQLGRGFVAGDGEDVVVLANDLWKRVFGRRKTLNGATLTLGNRTYAVVGVMPRGTTFPGFADAWLPLPSSADPTQGWGAMPLVRLRAGVTKDQADGEMKALGQAMTAQFSTRDNPIAFELETIRGHREELSDLHKAMVGAALAVLIIACVNLAHLMLARGLSKRRELALRMALGASRAATVRLMFAECAIITAAGACLGAAGAVWGVDILTNRMPQEVQWVGLIQPQLSWRVFAASALAAAAAAVLFGLVPAIRVAFAVSMDEPLKDGAGTTSRARQRYSPLVMAEVGLALILLMGGGLMLRTIQQLRKVQFTFDEQTLLTSRLGFRAGRDSTYSMARDALLDLVTSVPGVRGAATQRSAAAIGGALTAEMTGQDTTRTINTQTVSLVSWQYVRVFGLPILQGRDLEAGDGYAGNPVAVINPVAALRLYPNQDPVGKMIKLGAPERDAAWVRIVGVFRSPVAIRGEDLSPTGPMVLVADTNSMIRGVAEVLVRTARQDPEVAVAIRRKFHSLPMFWFASVESYSARRDADLRSRGFLANVFVSMGAVALALSALGLYGVLAYAVNQRMREFAVRIALGAAPRQLFRMVLHDGMVMLLAGIGIGAFGALAAARMLDAVLTNVLPSDVISLVAAEAVLLAVGFVAAFAPARRAVRANPLDILRAV